MDVRIYAFELSFGRGADTTSFFSFLKPLGESSAQGVAASLEKSAGTKASKILIIGEAKTNANYHTGLLLTIKDARAFCNLRARKGKLMMAAQTIDTDSAICDFNFFVLYKPTGRGLYQHYHQSTGPASFCRHLKDKYHTFSDIVKEAEVTSLRAANPGWNDGRLRAAAGKKISPFLQADVITRPDTMSHLIRELAQINSLTFEARSLEDYQPFGLKSKGLVKSLSHKMIFRREPNLIQTGKELAAKIVQRKSALRRATATGFDVDGDEVTFKLTRDYQVLTTYDYNDVVADIDMDDLVASVESAPMTENLLKLVGRPFIQAIVEGPMKK
jgi:hypothetical protein